MTVQTPKDHHPRRAGRTIDPLALLEEGVEKLLREGDWRAFLQCRARFRQYSSRNVFLILLQCPQATHVAGYRTWKQLGRQVKKGEKGIAILAPIVKTINKEGEDERQELVDFRTVYVFDVSQTEGKPLPVEPDMPAMAEADPRIPRYTAALERFCSSQGWMVAYQTTPSGIHGYWQASGRSIVVNASNPPLHRLKTLVHEMAHASMHGSDQQERSLEELEAESCAWLVCHQLGLDTSGYSFAYLASWSDGGVAKILAAARRASLTAELILTRLEA